MHAKLIDFARNRPPPRLEVLQDPRQLRPKHLDGRAHLGHVGRHLTTHARRAHRPRQLGHLRRSATQRAALSKPCSVAATAWVSWVASPLVMPWCKRASPGPRRCAPPRWPPGCTARAPTAASTGAQGCAKFTISHVRDAQARPSLQRPGPRLHDHLALAIVRLCLQQRRRQVPAPLPQRRVQQQHDRVVAHRAYQAMHLHVPLMHLRTRRNRSSASPRVKTCSLRLQKATAVVVQLALVPVAYHPMSSRAGNTSLY